LREIHKNLKVLLFANDLNSEVKKLILKSKYIRLLPFSIERLKCLLKNYGVPLEDIENLLPPQGNNEGLFEPLLVLELLGIFKHGIFKHNPIPLMLPMERTENMFRTLLPLYEQIIENKVEDVKMKKDPETYTREKNAMREIAANLIDSQGYLGDKNIEEIFVKFNIPINNIWRKVNHYLKIDNKRKRSFINPNILYNLAEYIIGCLIDGNLLKLNIQHIPPKTIEYLDGIIDLLKTNHPPLKKFVFEEEYGLANSYRYPKRLKVHSLKRDFLIRRINLNAFNAISSDKIYLRESKQTNKYFIKKTNKEYISLWNYRWLSLFVFNKMNESEIEKRSLNTIKLSELIKFSSNYVQPYLKNFQQVNLSYSDLVGVNLSQANLAAANLKFSNLNRADLSGADLSGADLSGADLSGADLSGADLSDAYMEGVNFGNTNLKGARLEHAILNFSDLSNCNLSRSNCKHANITNVILYNSNLAATELKYAVMSNSILSGADLSGADLSGADLSNSILSGADLSNCIFNHTKFTSSIMIDVKLYGTDIWDTRNRIINNTQKDLEIDLFNCILYSSSESYPLYDDICESILALQINDTMLGIRSIGVFDAKTCEFLTIHYKEGVGPLLTQKEKTMMLQISWKGYIHKNMFKNKIGKVIYSVEVYEKINRITIPLNNSEHSLFITTEQNFNIEEVLHVISEYFPKYFFSSVTFSNDGSNSKNDFIVKKESNQFEIMSYHLCNEIVNLPLIRTATICNYLGEVSARCVNRNTIPILNKMDSDESIKFYSERWKLRKKFFQQLGNGKYALSMYEKIKRITIPLNDGLLLVSFERYANNDETFRSLEQLIDRFWKND
jgi:uncharacterized protein YjbI with pentapeptide repeats